MEVGGAVKARGAAEAGGITGRIGSFRGTDGCREPGLNWCTGWYFRQKNSLKVHAGTGSRTGGIEPGNALLTPDGWC